MQPQQLTPDMVDLILRNMVGQRQELTIRYHYIAGAWMHAHGVTEMLPGDDDLMLEWAVTHWPVMFAQYCTFGEALDTHEATLKAGGVQ